MKKRQLECTSILIPAGSSKRSTYTSQSPKTCLLLALQGDASWLENPSKTFNVGWGNYIAIDL